MAVSRVWGMIAGENHMIRRSYVPRPLIGCFVTSNKPGRIVVPVSVIQSSRELCGVGKLEGCHGRLLGAVAPR